MTDDFPTPIGRDDQPTDEGFGAPIGRGDVEPDAGDAVAPSVVDFDDHERTDIDDPAKPGIDDYTD